MSTGDHSLGSVQSIKQSINIVSGKWRRRVVVNTLGSRSCSSSGPVTTWMGEMPADR